MLLDATAISNMDLADLQWRETAREMLDQNVVRIVGDFSGGPFSTLNATGEPQAVTGGLHERAAIYLPPNYPDVAPEALGFGMIMAVHHSGSVLQSDATFLAIVRDLEVPILKHGEYRIDATDLGLRSRNDMVAQLLPAMMYRNPCEPEDLTFGNFFLKLAEVDMRATTLLARIAEAGGGVVDLVALTGGSKEGQGCWMASGADPRIRVAACSGTHFQDLQALRHYQTDWSCGGPEEAYPLGEAGDTSSLVLLWHWLNSTPAGRAFECLMSVPRFPRLYPEFFFIGGGVGMAGTHDGKHYPIGAESAFLEGLQTPWRYDRAGAGTTGGLRREGLIYMSIERLIYGPAVEQSNPKIVSAVAEVDGRSFRVTAELDPRPADVAVRLIWNHSPDRVYNRPWFDPPEQPPTPDWNIVEMVVDSGNGNGSYTSDWVTTVPGGEEAAWYVEAEVEFTRGNYTFLRKDATPVRFLFRVPEGSCPGLEIPQWCE